MSGYYPPQNQPPPQQNFQPYQPQPQYGGPPPQNYNQPYAPPHQPNGGYPANPPQQWGPPPVNQASYPTPPTQNFNTPQQPPYGAPPPAQQQGYHPTPPPPAPGGTGGGGWVQPPVPANNTPAPFYNQPTPLQGPPVIPRTYLGGGVHPSDNPLLPPHERVKEGVVVDNYDQGSMSRDIDAIRAATKGFGTNERALTGVLVTLTSLRIPPLDYAYRGRHGTDLAKLVAKETSGNFGLVLSQLVRGPLGGDVFALDKAIVGLGTNEALLTELVIGRPPSSLELFRAYYNAHHPTKNFDKMILSELSLKTKAAFQIALMGEWRDQPNVGKGMGDVFTGPGGTGFGGNVNEQMVQKDMADLMKMLKPSGGDTDSVYLASIFFARSPTHLNRLQQVYLLQRRAPLTRHVKLSVSGHLQKAFLFALEGGKKDITGCWRDAKQLHKTMEGMGTKETLLTIRLVRAKWDYQRFDMIKQAYQAKYKNSLQNRVMKETSGHYRDALMAVVG
ncbi:hypothetical protein MNV49_005642 [Pseudohyphozyma bogoriensis]|nr:hypothetical protein MNV49_005642 [Pseudohyphozyma bogoriensis]